MPVPGTRLIHRHLPVRATPLLADSGRTGVARPSDGGDVAVVEGDRLLAVEQRDIAVRDVAGPVTLDDPVLGPLTLTADGFADRVMWNPGPDAALGDVPAGGAAGFVCIEAAQLTPVTLAPGETWTGSQTLRSTRRA